MWNPFKKNKTKYYYVDYSHFKDGNRAIGCLWAKTDGYFSIANMRSYIANRDNADYTNVMIHWWTEISEDQYSELERNHNG